MSMYLQIQESSDFSSMPISFTGRCLFYGAENPHLNPIEPSNILQKPISALNRGAYAFGVTLIAAPAGVIYHLANAIIKPLTTIRLDDEEKKQEIRKRAWQHLDAAGKDLKAFIQGVFLTAIGVSFAASTVLVVIKLEIAAALLGSLLTFAFLYLSPVPRYMIASENVLDYLPQTLENKIMGMDILKQAGFVHIPHPDNSMIDKVVKMYFYSTDFNRLARTSSFSAKIDIWTSDPEEKSFMRLQLKKYCKLLNHLKIYSEQNDEAPTYSKFLMPLQEDMKKIINSPYGKWITQKPVRNLSLLTDELLTNG